MKSLISPGCRIASVTGGSMEQTVPHDQLNEMARRLEVRKQILDLILRRREAENNFGIGACIEDQLIRQEIAALEPRADKSTQP